MMGRFFKPLSLSSPSKGENIRLCTLNFLIMSINYKKQFPIFSQNKPKKSFIYLDSAATSQKPQVVINAEKQWYEKYNANIHRGIYDLAEKATQEIENARYKIAEFIRAQNKKSIVFTKGATESINLVAQAWAKHNLKKGDVVLLTEMEHHANIVPWQQLAKEKGLKIKYWPIDKSGKLIDSPALLRGVKFLSLTHVSNVLGTVNPIERISKEARKSNIRVLVDGAQSIAHMPVDVRKLKPDFFVFSAHKMFGPTGVGVLYINPDRFSEFKPYQTGGDMIREVSFKSSSFQGVPSLLEAGTLPLAQIYALGKTVDFIKKIGIEKIKKYNEDLVNYCYKELKKIPEAEIYGPLKRSGLISFNIKNIHPHDLAYLLNKKGACVRAGHHCAQPLHKVLGVPATVRVSFQIYNNKQEVYYFIKSLKEIISKWNKFFKV